MVDRTMRGVYPILSMPFDAQDRIDIEDLQREVEWCVRQGVHGLGIALASEIFKLSESERDQVTRVVVEQVNGRVKVVVNTGAQGSGLAVQYSRRAEELGADAVMVTPPSAMPATPDETKRYFRRISDSVDVPIFIQDVSTAPVPPGLAVQIARESENACYIKAETPPTAPRVAEVKALGGDVLIVFGGAWGYFYLEELRRGSVGTMPGAVIPEVFTMVWDLFQDGKDLEATRLFNRYLPLIKSFGQGFGIAAYLAKEVLRIRGVFKAAHVRHPAAKPDDLAFKEIRQLVESLELEPADV
ncbi:MAG: dihydrodipicolinate synthase family protein [Chloroflexi bacterium]|nr:dihydrodipicolinate synthase family protein [Chloroflexota bacterium]